MDRIWLKHYPPGVPADINPSQYRSINALMDESFAKFRAAKGYSFMGKEFTFGEVDDLSKALGAWLQSKHLPRGARVAIMMPNVVQYPVAIAAILRAGYVVVNVNPLYTPRELEYQLKDSGAEAVIILENFAYVLQQVVSKTSVKQVVVASLGDMLGLKGKIVNFVVRKVKKLVPAWSLPGSTSFNEAIAAGKKHTLNPVDVKRRSSLSSSAEPTILGFDAAGVVHAVGSEVTSFAEGDEVWYAGDVTRPGSNAEFHAVDERLVARKPASLGFAATTV